MPSTEGALDLMENQLVEVIRKLLAYCEASDWAGWDPYDALNAKTLTVLPFLNHKFPRLALTQILKRSPINVRVLLKVPKSQNPKAIALFLSALLKLSKEKSLLEGSVVTTPDQMIEKLIALRASNRKYWCWGYNFPWQGRAVLVPTGAPNLVCTTFVASALLDAYEQGRGTQCLDMAVSAAEYILDELYWSDGGTNASFSYPLPASRSRVHNANFLASALLCRVYRHTGDRKFLNPALSVVRYSAARQNSDGSWVYGEASSQQWIDNFHSGYNICALQQIDCQLQSDEFEPRIRKGLAFYKARFIRKDGAVRYFHDRTYPIDIHCVAQTIITLLELGNGDPANIQVAQSVCRWALDNMWDERGFFYYRVLKLCTIRTSYMRWSQAWMCLAMSTLLSDMIQERSAQLSLEEDNIRFAAPSQQAVQCHG